MNSKKYLVAVTLIILTSARINCESFSNKNFIEHLIQDTLKGTQEVIPTEYDSTVSAYDIILQLGAGIGGGLITAIPGALIGSATSSPDGAVTGGLSGMYLGYVLGNAIGVNIAADKEKYSHSFPVLLLSSGVAAGIGLLLFNASDQKGFLSGAPLYLPPIISVITLNIFSRKNLSEKNVSIHLDCIRKQYGVYYSLHISCQL